MTQECVGFLTGNCCVFIIVKHTTNNFLREAKKSMTRSRKIFSNRCRLPASIVFFLQWGNLKYMTQDKHRAMLHWIYERMLFIFIAFIRLERYPLVLRSPSASLFISGLLSASTNNRRLIFTLCSLVKCSSARVEDGSGGWCTDVLGAYFFMLWPCCADGGILVPQPRIEPRPSAVRVHSPSH